MHSVRTVQRILVGVYLSLAGAVSLTAIAVPDLTGDWRLNRDLSDDPARVMANARESGGSAPRGGMGRGHGRHGGGGTRSQDDEAMDRNFFAALRTLHIRHRDPTLSITDDVGRERTLYTDDRKTEEERSYGGTTKVRARWKDGRIEVRSIPQKGPRVTETYGITADRTQLSVTTIFERGRGGDVTIHRIYDTVREGAPSPTPEAAPPAEDELDPHPAR